MQKQKCRTRSSSAVVGASGATSVSHRRCRAVCEANVSHLCSQLRAATFRHAVSSEIITTASATFHRAVYSTGTRSVSPFHPSATVLPLANHLLASSFVSLLHALLKASSSFQQRFNKGERGVFRSIKVYPLEPNDKRLNYEPPTDLLSKLIFEPDLQLSLVFEVKKAAKLPSKLDDDIDALEGRGYGCRGARGGGQGKARRGGKGGEDEGSGGDEGGDGGYDGGDDGADGGGSEGYDGGDTGGSGGGYGGHGGERDGGVGGGSGVGDGGGSGSGDGGGGGGGQGGGYGCGGYDSYGGGGLCSDRGSGMVG
ncbi:glycine-rich cell wall structural protein 1.0-like [Arachis stenosperma]|uniref:glycine-rich cell wall structural protein 1.0-like n=1 Tax=Arachis stenosperma TaxID=217475 RepID=UPI0025AC1A40|nr:glycine-rich cell wall structural protein 1.0-like [Arachis stenosperma]